MTDVESNRGAARGDEQSESVVKDPIDSYRHPRLVRDWPIFGNPMPPNEKSSIPYGEHRQSTRLSIML